MLLPTVDNDKRWDDMLHCVQLSITTMQKRLQDVPEPRDFLQNKLIHTLQDHNDTALNGDELQQLGQDAATQTNDHRAKAKLHIRQT